MRQKLYSSLGIVIFAFLSIMISADVVIFNEKTYPPLFENYGVYTNINASQETILQQHTNILNYIQQEEPLEPILLNQKEIRHMADVQNIVTRGQQLLMLWVLIQFVIVLRIREKKKVLLDGGILTLGILGVLALSPFAATFYNMHKLLFDNDLWLLNPATDNLIKMYPEMLFKAIATKISLVASIVAAASIAIGLYKSSRKETEWQK